MYLEISGRQTGKTTRLINQIYKDKSEYDIQILLSSNRKMSMLIKSKISNNKVKYFASIESLNTYLCRKLSVKKYVYILMNLCLVRFFVIILNNYTMNILN